MRLIKNDSRYITKDTLNECFEYGKHLKVDKVVTGNGFSTSFLKSKPKDGKFNIMIAPNKGVIIDKEKAYNNGVLDTNNHIGFFYKEGKGIISKDYDVLMFVADSFFLYTSKLIKLRDKIDLILVDEAHSIEIQSSFRWVLRDFDYKINKFLSKDIAISSITATPNHYTEIDVKIINKVIHKTVINTTPDRMGSINRCLADIRANKKVVVATNSMAVIYRLRNRKRVVRANFIIGTSLMRSCVTAMTVRHDVESNLTIISSRGFEGFDIMGEDYRVYFFEDRATDHEKFFISNLYQAINRTRKGAKYIEYSCRRRKEVKKTIDESDIDKFINDESLSVENKQRKEYEKFHRFVIFNQDKDGVFSIKKDVVSLNLEKESLLYDNGFYDFDKFTTDRNIEVYNIDELQQPVPHLRLPIDIKIDNLVNNEGLIFKNRLFIDDFYMKIKSFEKFKDYRLYILNHLIKSVYDCEDNIVRELNERERLGFDLLTNEARFERIVNDVIRAHNAYTLKKLGRRNSEEKRKSFKERATDIVAQVIQTFMNSQMSVPPNWVANRNYNLFTQISIDGLEIVAKEFEVDFLEIDIKSAFPRILYALNDMVLPDGFYGAEKKNKIKINVKLNDMFYKSEDKTPLKTQKNNAILSLRNLGVDKKVIDFIMDRFFEDKFRGSLFNFLSFYEKKIISEIKNYLKEFESDGIIRRHDSVIVLNNKSDISFVNQFYFLDQNGWFKVENTTSISSVDLPPDFDFFET